MVSAQDHPRIVMVKGVFASSPISSFSIEALLVLKLKTILCPVFGSFWTTNEPGLPVEFKLGVNNETRLS